MSVDRQQGIRRLTRLVREPAIHIRFFSSASDAVRARRPTDAVLFLAAVAWIVIASPPT